MNYEQSIRNIMLWERAYYLACERADTDDDIGAALEAFHRAKAQHAAKFGPAQKREGHWS
jgi:hypothetical protein